MRTAKAATRAPERTSQRRRSAARPGRGPKLALTVQYATRARSVPTAAELRRWIRAALAGDADITVRLTGIREARALNRTYRNRDYATNVLTFVLNDAPPYAGDLVLCAPVVAREARAQGKRLRAHYAHLTVHGVLHLQGYAHERTRDAVQMEALEKRILERLGHPDPYATGKERPQRVRRDAAPAASVARRASHPHGRHPQ
jgi:probable rRNA maturation factor